MNTILRVLSTLLIICLIALGVTIMARGHQDWFIQTGQFSFADIDTAELAARLGSPDYHFRSGRVIYLTGFEIDINDALGLELGTDGIVEVTEDNVLFGSRSLKITPRSNSPFYSYYHHPLAKIKSGRWGVEALIAPSENCELTTIGFALREGAEQWAGQIRLNWEAGELQYRDHNNAVQKIADLADNRDTTYLYPVVVKLIVDWSTYTYETVYVNDASYDLASEPIYKTTPAAGADYMQVQLFALDDDGTQGWAVFDNLIVTTDEP